MDEVYYKYVILSDDKRHGSCTFNINDRNNFAKDINFNSYKPNEYLYEYLCDYFYTESEYRLMKIKSL